MRILLVFILFVSSLLAQTSETPVPAITLQQQNLLLKLQRSLLLKQIESLRVTVRSQALQTELQQESERLATGVNEVLKLTGCEALDIEFKCIVKATPKPEGK